MFDFPKEMADEVVAQAVENGDESVGPTQPSLEKLVELIPQEKLIGERSAIIGLPPVVPAVVEKELEEIYLELGSKYDPQSRVAPLVARRILDEIELLARMSNPESTFRPDWYDEESDEDLIFDITNRDEFAEDFLTDLIETYGVPDEIASRIMKLIVHYVEAMNEPINDFYNQGEVSQ